MMSMNQSCIHSVKELQYFKPYGCGMCDLRFSNPVQLDDHLFVNHHSKVTAPRCCHCTKIFTSEKSLKIHIQAEHKSRRCPCPFCNAAYKTFRHNSTLNNRHMCPYCNKYFYRWKELNVHMSTHEKSIRCKICGKKFSSKSSMRQHLINEHSEEELSNRVSKI